MTIDDCPRSVSLAAARRYRPERVLPRLLDRLTADESAYDAVPRLEARVAELLGKPAAVLFPTGTMAQQVAMRIHADRRGVRTIAFHPLCHLEIAEQMGYAMVHGLTARLVGDRNSLIGLSDVEDIAEPIAALLLELPQRELGGLLPDWSELVAQADWARAHGAALHMDGARLWESQPYYGRPHAEIAGLFDSVYVSLYKGLMGISGAVLAGEPEFVAHARLWRDRLGGSMATAWPVALAGERGLDELLPRMPEFGERARALATLLGKVPGVRIVPDPPHTPLFHVYLAANPDAVLAEANELSAETGIRLFRRANRTPWPDTCAFEISVSAQLDDITDAEIGELVTELLRRFGH